MSVEIRPVRTDDEWRQYCFAGAYAFAGDRRDESFERRVREDERDWCLAVVADGTVVAGLLIYPTEHYINGGRIPLGGIGSVCCLPERRRQGHVGALLTRTLAVMRDAGQALSMLYTPHRALYNRYGWSIASRGLSYSFAPKAVACRLPASGGRWRRVDADEWRTLDLVYRGYAGPRNGALVRDERWWRFLFQSWQQKPADAAVWSGDDGEPRGYMLYRFARRPVPGSSWDQTVLQVVDWAVLDGEAYSAFVRYLLGHDHDDRIVVPAGDDEPFTEAFEESNDVETRAWHGFMLRVVDVQRAIEARPALAQASGKSLTVALTDQQAPWNAGTWHIECSEGRVSAERTNAPPGLEMDARAFAVIFNGFAKPAEMARIGEVRVHRAEALAAAADIFAASYAPYCPDDF